MEEQVIINKSTLVDIADKYRQISGSDEQVYMKDIPDKLSYISDNTNIEIDDSEWARSDEMPDLDSVDLSGYNSAIFATYDNRDRKGFYSVILYDSGNSLIADIGYVENGEFITIDTNTTNLPANKGASGYKKVEGSLENYDLDYVVIRFSTALDKASILNFYTYDNDTIDTRLQPVLEYIMIGYNTTGKNVSNFGITTHSLIKAKLIGFSSLSSLSGFQASPNLRTVEFVDCDFSNVSSVANLFRNCYRLNTIKGLFESNLSKVNSFSGWFMNCYGITELDISENFAMFVDSATAPSYGFFYGNEFPRLRKLTLHWKNIKGFTSLSSLGMGGLNSLIELDISDCDFSNVTNTSKAFQNMYNLRTVNIGNSIDFSKVTDANSMFSNCNNLRNVIADFDLSSCTNITSMFQNCYSINKVNLYNLGNVTSANTVVDKCFSLETLRLKGLTNKCTTLSAKNSTMLKIIDFENSDLSGLSATNATVKGLFDNTTPATVNIYLENVEYINIVLPEIDISNSNNINADNIITIFNDLPEVNNNSIKISKVLLKQLSDDVKEIATNKGWTIAG